MNEQKTAVMIDSGCDLPESVRKELDIRILPLRVIYPEKDYRDGVDIDPMMVYRRFPDEFPSTSTPSLAEVQDVFDALRAEGFEHILAICISSGLSGTFNTVRLAASDEENEDLDIFAFDTKNISVAAGLFAIWAAKKLQAGMPFEEIREGLQKKIGDSRVYFYMDTLKYLQRGGRIGRVTSVVGEMLKLKPIISCDETGTYYTAAKIRGARFGKLRLLEEALKFGLGHKTWIIVGEGDAHEEAQEMVRMLKEDDHNAQILFEEQITATMAINTGPGLVGIAMLRDPE